MAKSLFFSEGEEEEESEEDDDDDDAEETDVFPGRVQLRLSQKSTKPLLIFCKWLLSRWDSASMYADKILMRYWKDILMIVYIDSGQNAMLKPTHQREILWIFISYCYILGLKEVLKRNWSEGMRRWQKLGPFFTK